MSFIAVVVVVGYAFVAANYIILHLLRFEH
jgi:hypothetical protein